jgi:cytochrome P450
MNPCKGHVGHEKIEEPFCAADRRETLRMDPVVQMLFHMALRDFNLVGYTVPAGKQLLLPLKYLATHDSRWDGVAGDLPADVFAPERLMTPGGQKAGDLMPFGYGAR